MVDFLVIGPFGCITYSIVFPVIKDRSMVLGYNRVGSYTDNQSANAIWFTSLIRIRPEFLELTKTYDGSYKKFDNYDALNVDRTIDIPGNYSGVMGVPITFLEKWNPSQFDLLGMLTDNPADNIYTFNGTPTYTDERHHKSKCGVMDGRRCYNKLLIRRRKDG